jgi:pentatricopeptide repeat domain-containing protein 2
MRFGNFVFGPVVMRMYHHFNQPAAALEALKDPDLEGFFEQMASYQVLCDLLYRNQMYQEILEVFDIVKTKQVQGQKYPRNVTILVFAACYKMVGTYIM